MANELPAGRNRHGTIDNIGRTFVPRHLDRLRAAAAIPLRKQDSAAPREAADHLWTKDSIGKPLDQPFHIINETAARPNEAAIRRRVG
jgi:hypothetical protein